MILKKTIICLSSVLSIATLFVTFNSTNASASVSNSTVLSGTNSDSVNYSLSTGTHKFTVTPHNGSGTAIVSAIKPWGPDPTIVSIYVNANYGQQYATFYAKNRNSDGDHQLYYSTWYGDNGSSSARLTVR
jgi:hypothetical protein